MRGIRLESIKYKEAEEHNYLVCAVVSSKSMKKTQTFNFYCHILLKNTYYNRLSLKIYVVDTNYLVSCAGKKK